MNRAAKQSRATVAAAVRQGGATLTVEITPPWDHMSGGTPPPPVTFSLGAIVKEFTTYHVATEMARKGDIKARFVWPVEGAPDVIKAALAQPDHETVFKLERGTDGVKTFRYVETYRQLTVGGELVAVTFQLRSAGR